MFIIFITFFVYLILFNPFSSSNIHWLNKQQTIKVSIENIVFINKFISVLVGSFLFGNSFSLQQDAYNVLFLRSKKDKITYYLTKVFTITFVVFLIFVILSFSNILLFNYKVNYFKQIIDLVFINFDSLLLAYVYGMLSVVLIQMFKTQLVLILPLIMFIISDSINTNFLEVYFPTIRNIVLINDLIHKIFLFLIYSFFGGIIYYYKDL